MTSPTPAVRWRRHGLTSVALLALLGGAVAPAAFAAPDPEVPTGSLITGDTAWHYLDDGSDPSPAPAALRGWTLPAFDDSAWKTATGSFGAKGGKLAPVGPQTPKTLLNHYLDGTKAPTVPTYFFRTTFEIEAGVAAQVAALQSTITYDDAIIVWINGAEIARYVDGRITDTKNVEYAGDSNGDPLTSTFSAEGELLHDGTNTIAVSLFQDRETSSDIYFDMSSLTLVKASDPGTPRHRPADPRHPHPHRAAGRLAVVLVARRRRLAHGRTGRDRPVRRWRHPHGRRVRRRCRERQPEQALLGDRHGPHRGDRVPLSRRPARKLERLVHLPHRGSVRDRLPVHLLRRRPDRSGHHVAERREAGRGAGSPLDRLRARG